MASKIAKHDFKKMFSMGGPILGAMPEHKPAKSDKREKLNKLKNIRSK